MEGMVLDDPIDHWSMLVCNPDTITARGDDDDVVYLLSDDDSWSEGSEWSDTSDEDVESGQSSNDATADGRVDDEDEDRDMKDDKAENWSFDECRGDQLRPLSDEKNDWQEQRERRYALSRSTFLIRSCL